MQRVGSPRKYFEGHHRFKRKTTVTVVDVLPNGNLVIEGAKVIRTSQQDVYGYMRGIVRPVDISATNIVLSSKVADAQVEFVPAGELSDAQKRDGSFGAGKKLGHFNLT